MGKKRIKLLSLAIGLIAMQSLPGIANPVQALEETWGPQDRTMFTWDSPASYVTFNSISNNPFIGNETNFVRVKKYVEGSSPSDDDWVSWGDNITVEPGNQYEVFIYFHNNASASLNTESGNGYAQNTRVASSFPTKLKKGESGIIKGSVSATNANPVAVWDTAFFKADQTVYLSYIDNTAILHSSAECNTTDGTVLSKDALFASDEQVGSSADVGAMIACYNSDSLWGVIPGCNEYAGYVSYRVRADQPQFWLEKTVSQDDADEFVEFLEASPGDTLDFKIYYKNTGTSNQIGVVAHDELPSGMSLVTGSVQVTTPAGTATLTEAQEAELFSSDETGSLNIGDFEPGQEAIITYEAKVDSANKFDCGESKLYNDATVQTANGSEDDKVQVIVNKACEKNCKTNPEMEGCQELPNTGPLEIVMAAIIIAGIAGGGYYFYRTKKTLKTVENNAKSEINQNTEQQSDDAINQPKDTPQA